MKARELVLLVPALYLALSVDRLSPDRPPPGRAVVDEWKDAAPELPAVDEGRFGLPGDPLNLVFVATPQALRRALTEAGWTEIPTPLRGALAAGLLPMNDYRLVGRIQTMNWAILVRPLAERHHFRLWRTGMVDHNGRAYWWGQRQLRPQDPLARPLARARSRHEPRARLHRVHVGPVAADGLHRDHAPAADPARGRQRQGLPLPHRRPGGRHCSEADESGAGGAVGAPAAAPRRMMGMRFISPVLGSRISTYFPVSTPKSFARLCVWRSR